MINIKFFNIKLSKLILPSVFILTSGFDLTACSGAPNPLAVQNIKKVIEVLSQAESVAMKSQHLYYATGSVYVKCMTDPQNFAPLESPSVGQNLCEGLFQAMVQEARKSPGFENLNLADLKDPQVFQKINEPLSTEDSGVNQ